MLDQALAPHHQPHLLEGDDLALLGVERMHVRSDRAEVEAAIDRGVVVAVVVAGDEHHRAGRARDLRLSEADRRLRHAVRVEQVACDQQRVGLLRHRDVDHARERALVGIGLGAVPRGRQLAEVDVRGVDETQGPPQRAPSAPRLPVEGLDAAGGQAPDRSARACRPRCRGSRWCRAASRGCAGRSASPD